MRADRAAIVPANAHEPEPGEFVAPLSGCGCGKSTLLRALAGRERAWPNELPGGEQQRVALARSLVREPRLLLADEPFGALDALTRLKMHAPLRRLYEQHRPSVLLVTHDVDEAIALADRVLVLEDGRIATEQRFDGGASHAELRTVLLRALGVIDDDHDPADHDATSRDATAHDTTNHDAAARDVTGNDAADRDGSR
ncbi:ATP-binding cassette domain-containing protein [Nonomuraea fuscirosea]|uniref:ATP-binding cassette domain-containing protein n=1 Tax=Nonomuraea fuscirosea TaxID=1291556 RepID=UPI00340FE178